MAETPMKTITLIGPFSEQHIVELLRWLRTVEVASPEALFSCVVDGHDGTIAETERALRKAMPPMPGRQSTIKSWSL